MKVSRMILADLTGHFPQMRTGSRLSAQNIFDTAISFHEAGLRCATPVTAGEHIVSPTAPTIANYALACEMYLKALLKHEGSTRRGHQLNVLFVALKPETQARVLSNLNLFAGETSLRLLKCLQELSSVFVDWRYIYEIEPGRRIYVAALVDLTSSLLLTAEQITGWTPTEYLQQRLQTPHTEVVAVESQGGGRFLRSRSSPD